MNDEQIIPKDAIAFNYTTQMPAHLVTQYASNTNNIETWSNIFTLRSKNADLYITYYYIINTIYDTTTSQNSTFDWNIYIDNMSVIDIMQTEFKSEITTKNLWRPIESIGLFDSNMQIENKIFGHISEKHPLIIKKNKNFEIRGSIFPSHFYSKDGLLTGDVLTGHIIIFIAGYSSKSLIDM